MRIFISVISAFFLVTFTLFPGKASAEDVASFSMDSTDDLALQIVADTETKAEGEAALKITTPGATTVPIARINAPGVDKTRLTYTARVKTALAGDRQAYLEMWCIFKDGQYFSRGLDKPATGETDWTQLSTPFILQEGQVPEMITLNLVITGSGTVWIDDVHLDAGPLN